MNMDCPLKDTVTSSCRAFLLLLGLLLAVSPPALAQDSSQAKESEKSAQADKPAKADKEKEKKDADDEFTNLKIEVVAGEKNAPVAQASVYVKYMESRALRRDKKVELNLKTNVEGVTRLPDAPRGKVLIQVIAPGWKTFGQWYDLDQAEQTIKIQLQKPPRWY